MQTAFDVISDIEGDAAPFEEVISSLVLFDEMLLDMVESLDPRQPYTVELFTNRYERLAAMMSMIMRELVLSNNALHQDIENAYRLIAERRDQEVR